MPLQDASFLAYTLIAAHILHIFDVVSSYHNELLLVIREHAFVFSCVLDKQNGHTNLCVLNE